MNRVAIGKVLATGTVALSVTLAGCGSGSDSAASTSAKTTVPTTSTAAAPVAAQTVAEYLRENGVTMTPVKRGDPGSPELNLPVPAGWSDIGRDTPEDAWGAIALNEPPSDNPPVIVARMARLSDEADHAKILEFAPNAVTNEPGYKGPDTGRPGTLGGFDAVEIAGTVEQNDQTVYVARKTVVIPGSDALYLLALDAQGTPDQQEALILAMETIDADTTITP
ncbi:MAG: LpqN/LpqT family lipoprotein [Mycobacterium sp.]